MVKNPPANAGDARDAGWINPWGGEDPLKWEIETQSSILTWKIPWTEEPGGLQSVGSQRVRQLSTLSISAKRMEVMQMSIS